MNKKAQQIMTAFMIGAMVFITAVIMIEPLKDMIVTARNTDNLDCDAAGLSTPVQATCIVVDFWLFFFIGTTVALSITGVGIWARSRQSPGS